MTTIGQRAVLCVAMLGLVMPARSLQTIVRECPTDVNPCGGSGENACNVDIQTTCCIIAPDQCPKITIQIKVTCADGLTCTLTDTVCESDSTPKSVECGGKTYTVSAGGGDEGCSSVNWGDLGASVRCNCFPVTCS